MVAALVVFALGKPHYVDEMPRQEAETPAQRRERWAVLSRLFGVFGLMVFFWVAYEHNDVLWVYFARDHVNRDVNIDFQFSFWGNQFSLRNYTVPPDQIQVLNPLCVLLMVPLFNWTFKAIDPQARVITATRKILSGFILMGVAAGVMSVAGFLATGSGEKVSIVFPAVAYVLLTAGEVLLYGTGLELAYAVAPKNMKGFVTACFLVTATLGNFINIGLSQLYGPLSPGVFFALSGAIALAGAAAFPFVGRKLDRQMARDIARQRVS
jgi:dipeptide/tripeptide permease